MLGVTFWNNQAVCLELMVQRPDGGIRCCSPSPEAEESPLLLAIACAQINTMCQNQLPQIHTYMLWENAFAQCKEVSVPPGPSPIQPEH